MEVVTVEFRERFGRVNGGARLPRDWGAENHDEDVEDDGNREG